jgi:hypothetical protein
MAAGSAKALPQQLDLTIISTAFFGIQFSLVLKAK